MIAEIDIWRAANQLIMQYGEDAWLSAAQRADQMIANGDPEGEAVWARIARAIVQLQQKSSSCSLN